ncbi:hypothetical protein GCM10010492_18030 [Saccharothrix mutabilis subsp. mutabilis]|uniref:Uncharacterized protein n=1 Tax=Saccharothrix mutabilis subsp. mutabilis TaxID=66855 RepID=A0ABP3D386_9PSEU
MNPVSTAPPVTTLPATGRPSTSWVHPEATRATATSRTSRADARRIGPLCSLSTPKGSVTALPGRTVDTPVRLRLASVIVNNLYD